MNAILRHAFGRRLPPSPWSDLAPVREELFGLDRLERHAESLAAAQPVTRNPLAVLSLHTRLANNAAVLLAAYRASAAELEHGRSVDPAAEWLLDNYHVVEEQIREIRVDLPPGFHHLAGASGDLVFALLSDGLDADREVVVDDDALLAVAATAIKRLNLRHGPGPDGGDRFFLLHRRRLYNDGEGKWMGWERKRGKLHELNRLLRGATDTSFMPIAGRAPQVPADVRYVITLDADTRLPRDAALRLVGKMGHPLNRPTFDAAGRRVINGYAILQPRITPSLSLGGEGSLYQRIVSGPGGIDPYASAVSDVYQDLFGEGSFTGKGIYDVDALEAALDGRVPRNALLSHDLFEGVFARAGLASDVELVEEFPSRYNVAAKRQHRWTRGDWQLLPWILGHRTGPQAAPPVGRWKMLDNLRRSLLAPFTLATLAVSWLLPLPSALAGILLVLTVSAVPAFLPAVSSVLPGRPGTRLGSHVGSLMQDLRMAAMRTVMSVAFLADQAWRRADAIARTLTRLFVTHRHLLEWTTAAQTSGRPQLDLGGFYRDMAGGTALGLVVAAGTVAVTPSSWPLALPFALLWLTAPALAAWTSRPPAIRRRAAFSDPDARDLRLTARRTWRFFETFVTPAENMLPPDNFQEDPKPVVAHRTSPTNIGLYLLSTVAARDFGWSGTTETIERLEATFESMRKLSRFRGHFYNWYGTQDLRVLEPAYVSSVDSGNLAGHLIALANACEEWMGCAPAADARLGMMDTLALAREAADALSTAGSAQIRRLGAVLDEIAAQLDGGQSIEVQLPTLKRLTDKAVEAARDVIPAGGPPAGGEGPADLMFWMVALRNAAIEHGRDRFPSAGTPDMLRGRLVALADTARAMALAMDFSFLLDPERKLLSIGYALPDNSLDPSCYDLLASEARLASLFAIAKGDVATRHWFRLGRAATPVGNGSALISWSGSMFEYLMPALVMRAPVGSLLEQTSRLVVERQQAYATIAGGAGTQSGLWPHAISGDLPIVMLRIDDVEDIAQVRQLLRAHEYWRMKRLAVDLVIVNERASSYVQDLQVAIETAVRSSQSRPRFGEEPAQGSVYALRADLMRADARALLHSVARVVLIARRGSIAEQIARLQQQRAPSAPADTLVSIQSAAQPMSDQVPVPGSLEFFNGLGGFDKDGQEYVTILDAGRMTPVPWINVIANPDFGFQVAAEGGGSTWAGNSRENQLTPWSNDPVGNPAGEAIYLRDEVTGDLWSATAQPIRNGGTYIARHGRGYSRFEHRTHGIALELLQYVPLADPIKISRLTLRNHSPGPRTLSVTAYAEWVLGTARGASAPFIATEIDAATGAMLALNRWSPTFGERVAFADLDGRQTAWTADRTEFLGRNGGPSAPAALVGRSPLSGATGAGLDPCTALQGVVELEAGETVEIVWFLGQCASAEAARVLIAR
ncbi:hypothetical protein ABNQ38_04225 [Azospirillum sp. A29]|uniref:hypothetical protein n=1 Tax=Azospirillum sp. A29 TaxID=3160606 RepID=UPI003671111E